MHLVLKILKRAFICFIAVMLLFVASLFAFAYFVNPNDYKSLVAKQLSQLADRNITIEGDLAWQVFPQLVLVVHDVTVANTHPEHQPLLMMQKLKLSLNLRALLTNTLAIKALRVDDATVNWYTADNSRYQLTQLSIHSQGMKSARPFRFSMQGKLNHATQSVNFTLNSLVQLHTDQIHLRQGELDIRQDNGWIPQPIALTWQHLAFKKNGDYVAKQMILQSNDAGIHLQANGNINTSSQGEIIIPTLNPKKTLALLGVEHEMVNRIQQWQASLHFKLTPASLRIDKGRVLSDQISSTFSLQATPNPAYKTLMQALSAQLGTGAYAQVSPANFNLAGTFFVGQLTAAPFALRDITATLSTRDNAWLLAPITADINQGKGQGQVRITLSKQQPRIHLRFSGKQIDAASLSSNKLRGKLSVATQLQTRGINQAALRRQLSGRGTIALQQGVLEGIDMTHLWSKTRRLLGGSNAIMRDSGQTPITQASATFTIRNGLLRNADLLVTNPDFRVTGHGRIDLVSETLDYRLSALAFKMDNASKQHDDLALPLHCKGQINEPHCTPDLAALKKALLEAESKKQVNKLLDKVIPDNNDALKKGVNELIHGIFGG